MKQHLIAIVYRLFHATPVVIREAIWAVKQTSYRPAARDFWNGFDGVCVLTIVMGIFVLLRV